ncbi:hypothetical protein G7Z57_07185 [Streptococcus agalactiae]|uniref:hypothetical protein n=1 Tax=Streptococcus agalactiae TaxID=1311 RepID=UPI001C21BD00|nr:hypothetical protein [Streptococcus agalactiae]MBU8847253.1 hypothetical protein [Streptococcus agalactiae]MCD0101972.1 hypothetical protein [Streptococcus agalactiae]
MDFSTALELTNDTELAIKLMEADASQRKSEALASIAKTFNYITNSYGLGINIHN